MPQYAFCFGFALLAEKGEQRDIDCFRVQDHLRRMGLGRRSLEILVADILGLKASGGSNPRRPH